MIKTILGLIPGSRAMSWVINTVKNKHLTTVALVAFVSLSLWFGFVAFNQAYNDISSNSQDKKIEECRKQTETSLEECWNKVLN